jgi:N-acetylglucosaminyl-diphospho-decaprenol L-rhamnosyltransferase
VRPDESPAAVDVSVVVVSFNTRELLARCLESVGAEAGRRSVEIVVVDNGSSDGSAAMVGERFPAVRLIENGANLGFAAAANRAIRSSRAAYVLLLNSDAALDPGSLAALLERADATPRAAIVGARLAHADGRFQASHAPFPTLFVEALILTGVGRLLHGPWYPSRGPQESGVARAVDYVPGACLLVRRAAIEAVGLLDEQYFMYSEEVDWCYAMKRAGWQVWYEPRASAVHRIGASSQRSQQREALLYRGRVRFFRKHYGNAAATRLKLLILGVTAAKIVAHRGWELMAGGRRARQVIALTDLVAALRGV